MVLVVCAVSCSGPRTVSRFSGTLKGTSATAWFDLANGSYDAEARWQSVTCSHNLVLETEGRRTVLNLSPVVLGPGQANGVLLNHWFGYTVTLGEGIYRFRSTDASSCQIGVRIARNP